jgi:hypothetical protein
MSRYYQQEVIMSADPQTPRTPPLDKYFEQIWFEMYHPLDMAVKAAFMQKFPGGIDPILAALRPDPLTPPAAPPAPPTVTPEDGALIEEASRVCDHATDCDYIAPYIEADARRCTCGVHEFIGHLMKRFAVAPVAPAPHAGVIQRLRDRLALNILLPTHGQLAEDEALLREAAAALETWPSAPPERRQP